MLRGDFLNNKNKQLNNREGFTLIELLVVISIISLLSTVILASLNDARTKSKVSKVKADMIQIRNAAELYKTDTGIYPATTTDMIPKYLATQPVSPFGGNYGVMIENPPQINPPFIFCGTTANYNVELERNRLFVYLEGATNFPTLSFDKFYLGVIPQGFQTVFNKGPCIE